ncbi:MAG TPA: NADH-quinone oxidoreductase subunit C [Capsulimonadaceae bacterium]|jgi:Ni,Fe-hydrogenase III large subunit
MTVDIPKPVLVRALPLEGLADAIHVELGLGGRIAHLTARKRPDGLTLIAVMMPAGGHGIELWEADIEPDATTYRSLTPRVSQVHWYERYIWDMFGLCPEGHPRLKSLILHEAWPSGYHPLSETRDIEDFAEAPARSYEFLEVHGDGIYEIPVGPIHAGIIEPGHFRFSCVGEVIQNLEIRLGYQHRGIETMLQAAPINRLPLLAESIATDTPVGNALAHARAMEQVAGLQLTPAAVWLRALALEIERVASHVSDLGGICADIGYIGGAAAFSKLRGRVLGLGERLTGTRLQTSFVVPGGVRIPLTDKLRTSIGAEAEGVEKDFRRAQPRLLETFGALERMDGAGKVKLSLARDFGLVGPAGRASGIAYDVREWLNEEPYSTLGWEPATGDQGDVLARVTMRCDEVRASLSIIHGILETLPNGNPLPISRIQRLPANSVGIGTVEAWRGELVHTIITGNDGNIERYAIKDPSTNNWTGLAIAVRGRLVTDFPLCNKSFSLSYSGNDL